ncbi:MAG: hypothetical protein AAGI63_04880 [Planctomycetota bacterium]
MSLPISTSFVARTAGQVAKQFGQVFGFEDVLAESKPIATVDADDTAKSELKAQLIQQIQSRLKESGLDLNHPLELSVETDGKIRVESQHTRAAEVEAILANDAEIRQLAQQWSAAGNRQAGASPIDLTIPASTASILPVPGGYPNW